LAAAASVASESIATVIIDDSCNLAIAPRRAASSVSFAKSKSVPSPACAIPIISRGVAHVNDKCPASTCSLASEVHLVAFIWGRSWAPGWMRDIVEMLRCSPSKSMITDGVGSSWTDAGEPAESVEERCVLIVPTERLELSLAAS
jgi:hypothetical protein